MVTALDDSKRLSISTKLADIKALQNLLINNEEQLIQDCTDDDIRKPSSSEFKPKVAQLRTAVRTHINQEENEVFPKLRNHFSDEEQK